MVRVLLAVAIQLLRWAHLWSMEQYRSTHQDRYRQAALGLMYAEARARIERSRLGSAAR